MVLQDFEQLRNAFMKAAGIYVSSTYFAQIYKDYQQYLAGQSFGDSLMDFESFAAGYDNWINVNVEFYRFLGDTYMTILNR